MKNNFRKELNEVVDAYVQVFMKAKEGDRPEEFHNRLEHAQQVRDAFADKFQNAGIPYIPESVAEWFNHPKISKQRELGMSVREIFLDIDKVEYELFMNLDLSDWNSVIGWIDENEEDFIYLWLNESYKVLVKETYYLYNPFEHGYVSETGGITHKPKLNGKKYSIDEINDIDPKLMEWAVRIDEA